MHTPLDNVVKSNAQTFRLDDDLPKLPIPNVADTFSRYLSSVKALVSDDLPDLECKINAFVKSGECRRLQSALTSRSHHLANWLDDVIACYKIQPDTHSFNVSVVAR